MGEKDISQRSVNLKDFSSSLVTALTAVRVDILLFWKNANYLEAIENTHYFEMPGVVLLYGKKTARRNWIFIWSKLLYSGLTSKLAPELRKIENTKNSRSISIYSSINFSNQYCSRNDIIHSIYNIAARTNVVVE